MHAMFLIPVLVLSGCVSVTRYESMRHRAEAAEGEVVQKEGFIAGAHDDNATLQRTLIEQEALLRSLAGGMAVQAAETAKIREGCDI